MVVKTISIPDNLFMEAKKKEISLSKAAQIGIELCLKGGVGAFDEVKNQIRVLKDDLELKTVTADDNKKKLKELNKRFTRKIIELTLPEIHQKLINKEPVELDITEIRAKTGEKLGLSDLSDAYGEINEIESVLDA
jgi:hypothetical protein